MNTASALAGPGWGHMGDDGWTWAWAMPMMLFCVALVVAVVWLIVRAAAGIERTNPAGPTGTERAQGILAERYARGEISTEEYEERLAKLA
ncbi:SHOCT domain-containing protein [Actinomadura scrupuli]|uniref:SHOCT domain-containing protein n=1 Tax=Actinomadura scrupuli TaxID=559629 RepID=UPI003D95810A